jgi:hypothetical protein
MIISSENSSRSFGGERVGDYYRRYTLLLVVGRIKSWSEPSECDSTLLIMGRYASYIVVKVEKHIRWIKVEMLRPSIIHFLTVGLITVRSTFANGHGDANKSSKKFTKCEISKLLLVLAPVYTSFDTEHSQAQRHEVTVCR